MHDAGLDVPTSSHIIAVDWSVVSSELTAAACEPEKSLNLPMPSGTVISVATSGTRGLIAATALQSGQVALFDVEDPGEDDDSGEVSDAD